jgi:uncharacterized protein
MATQITGSSIAWRGTIAATLTDLAASGSLRFTEVVAENLRPGALPESLLALRDQGVVVIPHGVGLGLAGADLPDAGRLARLRDLARELGAPLVSEHVAVVRAADTPDPLHGEVLEAGHLLPPPRTRAALTVLCDNISRAQEVLGVPLALENIAALISWPEDEFDEPEYLTDIVRRTGVSLVLDVANLFAGATALGGDPIEQLDRFPLGAIVYVHTAGGRFRGDRYIDTHDNHMVDDVIGLLSAFIESCHRHGLPVPGIVLERDGAVTESAVLADLQVINRVLEKGRVDAVTISA